MPGLLRGVARTAVIAGTATSVSNRVSRRQAQRWGAQEAEQYQEPPPQAYQQPPPPPPAAAAPAADPVERLGELADLRDRGVLTDEEFAAAKSKILAG
jgi:Short C-terminal domain